MVTIHERNEEDDVDGIWEIFLLSILYQVMNLKQVRNIFIVERSEVMKLSEAYKLIFFTLSYEKQRKEMEKFSRFLFLSLNFVYQKIYFKKLNLNFVCFKKYAI
jgi:hypothetical protein